MNASHARANDTIIKFGHSCLSTSSLSRQHTDKRFIYVLTKPDEDDIEWLKTLVLELKQTHELTVVYTELKYYQAVLNAI